ncbi:MAG: hypothetical protein Q7T03_08710 [Deltaproteobacteria bacterium]|nr:hypothetical protein [Deltaproteobacteria bacterium]
MAGESMMAATIATAGAATAMGSAESALYYDAFVGSLAAHDVPVELAVGDDGAAVLTDVDARVLALRFHELIHRAEILPGIRAHAPLRERIEAFRRVAVPPSARMVRNLQPTTIHRLDEVARELIARPHASAPLAGRAHDVLLRVLDDLDPPPPPSLGRRIREQIAVLPEIILGGAMTMFIATLDRLFSPIR